MQGLSTEQIMAVALDLVDETDVPLDSGIHHPGDNIRKIIFCTCLLLLGTLSASAQYIGPGSEVKVHSVAQLLKVGKNNQKISLEGFLIRQTGPEIYVFSDGTGEINARIDEDKFPINSFLKSS